MKTLITGAGSSMDIDKECFVDGKELIKRIINLTSVTNPLNVFALQIVDFLNKREVKKPESILNKFNEELQLFLHMDDVDIIMADMKKEEIKIPVRTIDEFLSDVMIFPEYDGIIGINEKGELKYTLCDAYIDIGKYAIFCVVMHMESKFDAKFPSGYKSPNWIHQIKEELDKNKDNKIITFNYDRLIEHMLGKEYECRILHVYGTVDIGYWRFGIIPTGIGDDKSKGEIEYKHLGDFKIINDRVREPKSSGIIGIERIAQSLQRLNFVMGFGYDFYNIRNLGLLNHSNRTVYANILPNEKENNRIDGFKNRKIETDKIRRLIPDANFTYYNCQKVIEHIKKTD